VPVLATERFYALVVKLVRHMLSALTYRHSIRYVRVAEVKTTGFTIVRAIK
jgi:hypothetical protein